MKLKIVRDHFRHEFCALIGVKVCWGTPGDEERFFDHCDDERRIVLFPYVSRKNLAGGQILNCCQIPKLSLEFEKRHITYPNEVWDKLICGNSRNEVRVAVVVRGDRTKIVVFSPRGLDPEKLHDPFRPFVVDLQVERHFVLTVGRVVYEGIGNTFDERLIFRELHRMTVDILPGDAEGGSPHRFDRAVGSQLNFFSLNSSLR